MKKLFTTLFIAMLAVATYAQFMDDPTMLTFKTFTQGNNPKVFNCDKVFMYLVDQKDKMECDEHIRQFKDGKRFTTRLKTSSTSGRNSQIFLSVKAVGTLIIYASSASSESDRQIVVMKGAKDIVTDVVEQSNKRPIIVDIEKVGEYQIAYPDGPINIYGIQFKEKKAEPAAEEKK